MKTIVAILKFVVTAIAMLIGAIVGAAVGLVGNVAIQVLHLNPIGVVLYGLRGLVFGAIAGASYMGALGKVSPVSRQVVLNAVVDTSSLEYGMVYTATQILR